MIPEFPKFKKLELSDKEDIEKITSQYPPYSDFNFVSMWSWDIKGEMRLATLNGNLVVRFTDYLTGEPFYSFLGRSKTTDTVKKLLELSCQEGLKPLLKLLPEDSISELPSASFILEEDRDNFDYIYAIDKLKTYDGNRLRAKRNFVNRFKRNYTHSIARLDPSDYDTKKNILHIFDVWSADKKLGAAALNERQAFERIFTTFDRNNFIYVGIFVNDRLVGVVINELLPDSYAIIHFEKADEKYIGIYASLMLENANVLAGYKREFLNFEQDLGIDGLRLSKQSFNPVHFLKKYTLRAQ